MSSPRRLRATYTRYDGVMHMLAALDLTTGKIYYRTRKRKRWREFLGLLKALRSRWPGEKLYVVMDPGPSTRPGPRGKPRLMCSDVQFGRETGPAQLDRQMPHVVVEEDGGRPTGRVSDNRQGGVAVIEAEPAPLRRVQGMPDEPAD